MQNPAIVDHAYTLGAAGQGLARHIEEIGQPGQAGGKRVGDLRSDYLARSQVVERCPWMSLAQARGAVSEHSVEKRLPIGSTPDRQPAGARTIPWVKPSRPN